MILNVFFEFWTNQTMLKLTYCNLHHHLVLLIFHNTILQDTQNIHVMNTSLWEYTFLGNNISNWKCGSTFKTLRWWNCEQFPFLVRFACKKKQMQQPTATKISSMNSWLYNGWADSRIYDNIWMILSMFGHCWRYSSGMCESNPHHSWWISLLQK
jgi:hypothetical protein